MGMLACPSMLMADVAPISEIRFRNFCSWIGLFAVLSVIIGVICAICTRRKKLFAWLAMFAFGIVMLISLLPLFKPPYAEGAKYEAEVIPVIANLCTKIELYQYYNGKLPCLWDGTNNRPVVETWMPLGDNHYTMGHAKFSGEKPPLVPEKFLWFGSTCDVDCRDFKGKYSRPSCYQYLVMLNDGTNYAYFVGCFGDGNGLRLGTGYAVCKIQAKGHKYVGTWQRYKLIGDVQACFTSDTEGYYGTPDSASYIPPALGCYVPDKAAFDNMTESDGRLDIIYAMANQGWHFDGVRCLGMDDGEWAKRAVESIDENTIRNIGED